ncbi:hypothetical protein CRM22_007679 [Opisthorchis felineus]|uniref:Tafazzin family protein n=1 Tax=Opisthorchis felineus TaxID=147828 RepID=A0A4S2LN36_OPIFE|nr:hypothetical protein CRM22_007679 [Opisthorchis felineus]
MDLVYRLNRHSSPVSFLRAIFQPLTYPFFGALVKLALIRHHLMILNWDAFNRAYAHRPKRTPLITVSNHHSCLDDFMLFGSLLSLLDLTSVRRYRWTLTAVDICFTTKLHSFFFNWGKGIPVWRTVRDWKSGKLISKGGGVDQPSMNFSLDLLNRGDWIHVFPQGRIIHPYERDTETDIRLRWGVGRLIAESKVPPIVLPIWHCGFDTLNPSDPSDTLKTITYILGKPQCLTIGVGEPLDVCSLRKEMQDICDDHTVSDNRRSLVHARLTDIVQRKLYALKARTDKEHQARLCSLYTR